MPASNEFQHGNPLRNYPFLSKLGSLNNQSPTEGSSNTQSGSPVSLNSRSKTQNFNGAAGNFDIVVAKPSPQNNSSQTSHRSENGSGSLTTKLVETVVDGLSVIYDSRNLVYEDSQALKNAIKQFLMPYKLNSSGERELIKWSQTEINIMAGLTSTHAKRFCTREEDRQLINVERVKELRRFLVELGACVEARIGRAFIAEGCRMLASFHIPDDSAAAKRKMYHCFDLMLQTVIFTHLAGYDEDVPIWDLGEAIADARRDFRDESGAKLLWGEEGIVTDEEGKEHPVVAVLINRKYCTIHGCISCRGIIHPPSYFEKDYPKLAKAMVDQLRADCEAWRASFQEGKREYQNSKPPMRLTHRY